MLKFRKAGIILLILLVTAFLAASASFAADHSKPFKGVKVNGGTVAHSKEMGKHVLTLSADFQQKIDAPDPHWMVVDGKGNTYLLQRFEIKGDKYNRKITMPPYIKNVAKVQFWCAFAETLLGEAAFDKPVK
jgi:hypothetical protein